MQGSLHLEFDTCQGMGWTVSRQSENVLVGQSRNVLLTWLTLGGWKPKDRY